MYDLVRGVSGSLNNTTVCFNILCQYFCVNVVHITAYDVSQSITKKIWVSSFYSFIYFSWFDSVISKTITDILVTFVKNDNLI